MPHSIHRIFTSGITRLELLYFLIAVLYCWPLWTSALSSVIIILINIISKFSFQAWDLRSSICPWQTQDLDTETNRRCVRVSHSGWSRQREHLPSQESGDDGEEAGRSSIQECELCQHRAPSGIRRKECPRFSVLQKQSESLLAGDCAHSPHPTSTP